MFEILNNQSKTGFSIGEWQVSPDEGVLTRDDEIVHLEPKVMDVLVYFVSRSGDVITREELERDVWKGALVGYDAVTKTIIKLRKALQDDARHPRYIATIAKKGYQLIASVNSLDIRNKQAEKKSTQKPFFRLSKYSKVSITAVGVILASWLLIVLMPFLVTSHKNAGDNTEGSISSNTFDKIPSIVVLPFKNLSDDLRQDYLSDGITDDIITDLSKISSLHVIARQSSYYFKDNQKSLDKIAQDLGVQYIVEGSVQKSGKRIRVNVQLTSVDKGYHIWADRFDTDVGNIFNIQDEITRHVIEALYVTLSSQENDRVLFRRTNNFDAYDIFLLGQQTYKDQTKEGFDLTSDYYRRAINVDPNYARVYGAMAVVLTDGYRHGWTELSFEEARERALKLAKKAVALDQTTQQIYWSLGFVHLFRKEFQEAEAAAKQAIVLSPNYADGYGLLAFIANWRGKAEEAERYIKKAISLNPYHTFDYPWNLGLAYYTMGKYTDAVEAFKNALERNQTANYPRLYLAASYVRLGQLDDAEWEIEQTSVHRPGTTLSHLRNTLPYKNKKLLNSLLVDLRKAGLPD